MILKMDCLKSPLSSRYLIAVAVIFLFFFSNGASGATFTVVNDCGFTVWPQILSRTNASIITGFELTEATSHSFQVPAGWMGRLWGRTGCIFVGSGHGSCATGECGTECNADKVTTTATLAEFALNQYNDLDFYDVSIADGYNLQMLVEVTGELTLDDCAKTGCIDDLNQRCPPELILEGRSACRSACQAFGLPVFCCNSSLGNRSCSPTPYSQLFKSACPKSYSYATDDITSTFTCKGGNYTIRFCPPADAFSRIKPGEKIGSTDLLVSTSGKFTLGFFDSNHSYLGIWHTSDVQSRIVWVANPNAPIISTSDAHALSIDPETGNLIVVVEGKTLMNITDLQR